MADDPARPPGALNSPPPSPICPRPSSARDHPFCTPRGYARLVVARERVPLTAPLPSRTLGLLWYFGCIPPFMTVTERPKMGPVGSSLACRPPHGRRKCVVLRTPIADLPAPHLSSAKAQQPQLNPEHNISGCARRGSTTFAELLRLRVTPLAVHRTALTRSGLTFNLVSLYTRSAWLPSGPALRRCCCLP